MLMRSLQLYYYDRNGKETDKNNAKSKRRARRAIARELKQSRRRRQQKPDKFAYLTMENRIFNALHVHFSAFDILKTFSFFLRRQMTCFAVVWTT